MPGFWRLAPAVTSKQMVNKAVSTGAMFHDKNIRGVQSLQCAQKSSP